MSNRSIDIPIKLHDGGVKARFPYDLGDYDIHYDEVKFKTIEIEHGVFIAYAYSKKTKQIAVLKDGWKVDRRRKV